jgi:hypothetical protein
MNKLEFSEQMSRMTEAFGEKIYTASRTALIWKLVEDMEPGDFRRVVDHFIRTCRQAPLPADFDQATIPYRRKILPDTGALDPLCLRCNDVGFIRVRYHEDTEGKSATLMRCSCPNGKRHSDLFIPTWERGLEAAFAWDACPLEWFKPRFLLTKIFPVLICGPKASLSIRFSGFWINGRLAFGPQISTGKILVSKKPDHRKIKNPARDANRGCYKYRFDLREFRSSPFHNCIRHTILKSNSFDLICFNCSLFLQMPDFWHYLANKAQ